jgi:hypothetical protein
MHMFCASPSRGVKPTAVEAAEAQAFQAGRDAVSRRVEH